MLNRYIDNFDYNSRFRILKGGKISLVVSALLGSAIIASAAPTGGTVTSGNATISQSGNVTNINQSTQKASINWQGFSINSNETVNFNQPNVNSITLNRVVGNERSVIDGALNANGQVWILNSNGVLFNKNAKVNTAGIVATTKEISDSDFQAGNYKFSGNSSASVVNLGTIEANESGYVALLANTVQNDGTIKAYKGTVHLTGASEATINLNGNSIVSLTVNKGVLDALVENKGAVIADGGKIYLTTNAVDEILKGVVNNTGILEANSMDDVMGHVEVFAHGGTANISGIIDASAPESGDGGFIETSGRDVNISEDVQITTYSKNGKTGTWLIDPYDIVVASSGGHVTGATIATALNNNNVILDTSNSTYGTGSNTSGTNYTSTPAPDSGNGDITINDTITKTGSSATTLTLKAHNDININNSISSSSGRLNVVLTADQDNSGAGDVNFGSTGKITTNNGNFYVGSVSGTYDTVTATAQNFTMATGSSVDVGAGNLDIKVKNDITLADNSTQTNTYSLMKSRLLDSNYRVYFNGNNDLYYPSSTMFHKISLTAGGDIISGNTDSTKADIITAGRVVLSANGEIGANGKALKIEGSERAGTSHTLSSDLYNPFPSYSQSLEITNNLGNTYIAEINKQIFGSISLNVGASTNGVQNINIMNDARGTGNGHIIATANNGTLSVATNGIVTKGVKRENDDPNNYYDDFDYNADSLAVYATSVSLSAPTIELADNAIVSNSNNYRRVSGGSVWSYTHVPTLSLSGTTILASDSAKINGTYETSGFGTVYLNALNIGSTTQALEISTGSLSIFNSGGNTYLANTNYGSLFFEGVNSVGTHHVLSSNGDFFNVKTGQDVNSDSTLDGLLVETISGTSNGSNWGGSTGIHTATQFNATGNNNQGSGTIRNVSLSARTGGIIFGDNSVNVGGADFTASINNNSSGSGRLIRSLNAYDAQNQVAQITAGNVYFNNYVNDLSTPISIGGGDYHIQIARGSGTERENSLNLTTTAGEVNIHELTPNHFKTINTTLNNSNVAQNIYIDLAGDDHIQYSDTGSRIFLDANKVKLDSYNRNWNFNANSRQVQLGNLSTENGVVANTLGTGYYTVNASRLYLDSDVLTNGGALNLTGSYGIDLMRDIRIDSNADDIQNSASTEASGFIYLSGQISGASADKKLVVDSSSDTTNGGSISMYSNLGNGAGNYLTDFKMTAKGSNDTNDGGIYFYGSNYLLDGNFHVTGNTYLYYSTTIDTEQGNTKDAGNITFDGTRLYTYNNTYNFNTATTASAKNGGNIDLYNTYYKNALSTNTFTLNALAGEGGTSGSIYLPSINTTTYTNQNINISGGDIVLYGDLLSNFGNITLNGDVQLANNILIDTWNNTSSTKTPTQNGNVIINGGLFAIDENKTLTIDTSNNTGNNDFVTTDGNTHNLSDYYTHNAGSVTINGGITNGSYALGALNVSAIKGGDYNNGVNGTIALNGITTSGNQSYIGNTTNITGSLNADTIVFDTRTQDTTVTSTGVITANNLLLKGNATDYSFLATDGNKVSKLAANGVKSIAFLNNDVNLIIDTIQSIDGINATGTINLATKSSNITINENIETQDTSDSAIIINAGKDSAAGTSTGGDIIHTAGTVATGTNGRTIFYSGSILGTTGLPTLIDNGNFRYNSDESDTNYSLALGTSGNYLIYREQPLLSVTPSTASSIYGSAINLANVTGTIAGYKNNDDSTTTTGTATFTTTATNTSNAGLYDIAYSTGLLNSLGYGFADNGSSVGEYTIIPLTPTPEPEVPVDPTPEPEVPVEPKPTLPPITPVEEEKVKEIEKVITTIVNTQQVSQPIIPVIVNPIVVNTPIIQPTISGGMSLVSQTIQGQPNQVITLSELRTQNNSSNENTNIQTQDVRVSLNGNSIIELVNGGVSLPDGVDQEFYLVRQDSNNNGAN